ncbi:hypothetical protein GCM10029978_034570 [Actinoallomurus acanthiterrae]
MQLTTKNERCNLDPCSWCDRDDWDCRWCRGTRQWRPEKPSLTATGAIEWIRIEEPCRMCWGTGKEHGPLPGMKPTRY